MEFILSYEERKKSHIDLSLKDKNQVGFNGLSLITLTHEALPECNFEDLDISQSILGTTRPTPFFASGMTGGFDQAVNINLRIAKACDQKGWMMGLGSQRKLLDHPEMQDEWSAIKNKYPDLYVFGNLGLSQLIHTSVKKIEELVRVSGASLMMIHTNPLQECMQPEGTPQFRGGLQALEKLAKELSVPVCLKETGCGFSTSTLKRLIGKKIKAVDLSGYGGTHWGRIEGDRAAENSFKKETAQTFSNWGQSTLHSLLSAGECKKKDYEVWASGGIRNGLDAAKSLALKAQAVGFAGVILESALQGEQALNQKMTLLEYELKTALFCTGSVKISDLHNKWTIEDKNHIGK